ncbi:MAG: hypothetical protein ACFKPT_02545 [Gloeotrichia echinulata GP01]
MVETPYRKVNVVDASGELVNLIGGGGSGDASATNQTTQITRETEIRDRLMPPGTRTRYLGTSNGANLKSSAGTIYAITASNSNAAVRYFQLFEKASAPTLNDVPVECFPIYANDGLLIIGQDILGGAGISLATGISWGFSSNRLSYTAATAADCIASVRWT